MSVSGFLPNTHIETGDDRLLIADISPGMYVLGVKKRTAKPAKVRATYPLASGTRIVLNLANGAILTVGPGTKVQRVGVGWVHAERLHAKDAVHTLGGIVGIDSIETIHEQTGMVSIDIEGKFDICAEGVLCRP